MMTPRQKTSRIGPIGDDWALVELREVAEPPQYGLTASTAKTGNTQFLRITDIEGRSVNWASVPYCYCPSDDLPKYRLASGDILFARIGATTGKSTLIYDPPNAVFASYLIRVRTRPGLDAEFLSHFFQSQAYWVQIDGNKHTNLKKGVNGSVLKALLVPAPPLAEQRQIARLLSAVQRLIERQDRLIALSAEFKKALLQKLFTEGTRGEPLQQTEIGPVPKSWEIKRISEVSKLLSGGTPSKANAAFWNGPIPWASPKDMKLSRLPDTEDHISQAALEDGSQLVPAGSIFVVIRGMILMRDVPVAQAAVPMAFNQDMKALVGHRGVSSDFLLYSMQRAREQLLRKVGLSAHGTRTLMTSAIEQLPIAVPSALEQDAISQALLLTEAKQSVHRRTAKRMRELFRTLLHQLMTAQVRVHDLDLSALDEPPVEFADVT